MTTETELKVVEWPVDEPFVMRLMKGGEVLCDVPVHSPQMSVNCPEFEFSPSWSSHVTFAPGPVEHVTLEFTRYRQPPEPQGWAVPIPEVEAEPDEPCEHEDPDWSGMCIKCQAPHEEWDLDDLY